jgi:hypothetical protein
MDSTILLAVLGGMLCGAAGVGSLTIGFLWWQSYRRTELLRSSLNYQSQPAPPALAVSPAPPPGAAAYNPYGDYMPPSVPSPLPSSPPVPPPGVRPGSVWLDGVGGIVAGQRITVYKDETLLGRSGACDVQLHDPKVSRQHALLRHFDRQYYLYDMQSSGGTFVNGQRIETYLLRDYDQIQMGDSVIVFRRA